VIGYYFGSRGVQEAQTSADEARKIKEEVAAERWKLAATLNPTYDEVSLKGPEEMPDIIEPGEASESGEQSDT